MKHQKTRKQKTSRAAAAEVTVITAWTQQRGEAGQSIPGRRAGPDQCDVQPDVHGHRDTQEKAVKCCKLDDVLRLVDVQASRKKRTVSGRNDLPVCQLTNFTVIYLAADLVSLKNSRVLTLPLTFDVQQHFALFFENK